MSKLFDCGKNTIRCVAAATAILLSSMIASAQKPLYMDETAPIDDRVTDLLERMTVDEKIDLLRATSPANERLGFDKYYHGNEALHGVVRPGKFTVFPQAIGLAATWNPELIYQVSNVISDEARAKWNELDQGRLQTQQFSDVLTFWSPTVNMARDPRWGRTPETYGEDPFLTGEIGTAFVKGLQGNDPRYLKVVSTPKHFAANNEEHNRFECNAVISEKQLREYYLAPYEALVKRGRAASIMSAYNALNGIPCTCNPWLLTQVLRNEWGFDGYVVSDCWAPTLLFEAHKFVKEPATAATLSIKAGLDLECGDEVYVEPLKYAYKMSMVSDEDIDRAARRVLTARMRLGLFDSGENNPYTKISPDVIGSEKHQEIALQTAREAIVLLKNNKILPLKKGKIKSVAVVGINAASCEFGDYSGSPASEPISILRGIREFAGNDIEVRYADWVSANDGMQLISAEYYPKGVKAEYYKGTSFEGTPNVRTEEWINYDPANVPPDPMVPIDPMSARWTGTIRPPVTGEYHISLYAKDGCRLEIDGKEIFSFNRPALSNETVAVTLEGGKDYDIKVEYFNERDYSIAQLKWRIPSIGKKERIELYGKAGNIARECDAVIAVMGINRSIEREGKDRTSMDLPEDQQEFIKEIYRINPNTILVLVAGSPLSILWEEANLPAIVNAWYPGEKGGTAVAEVLFGKYNPAGRVPLTWHNSLDELPAFDDYDITKRTYKYFEGDVLYPFGYGLSYTTFKYSDLKVEDKGETVDVSFMLKNTGKYDGDEVAQVYIQLPEDEGKAPIKELKGFQRVHLKKGETKRVTVKVRREDLRYWSEKENRFIHPEGTPNVLVGSSSQDIRLISYQ